MKYDRENKYSEGKRDHTQAGQVPSIKFSSKGSFLHVGSAVLVRATLRHPPLDLRERSYRGTAFFGRPRNQSARSSQFPVVRPGKLMSAFRSWSWLSNTERHLFWKFPEIQFRNSTLQSFSIVQLWEWTQYEMCRIVLVLLKQFLDVARKKWTYRGIHTKWGSVCPGIFKNITRPPHRRILQVVASRSQCERGGRFHCGQRLISPHYEQKNRILVIERKKRRCISTMWKCLS